MAKRTAPWTRDEINSLLETNPKAVEQAMLRLWDRQTRVEQQQNATIYHNTVGFSAFHARSGMKFAKFIMAAIRKGVPAGERLYGTAAEKALKIALRHSKQLVEVANERLEKAA